MPSAARLTIGLNFSFNWMSEGAYEYLLSHLYTSGTPMCLLSIAYKCLQVLTILVQPTRTYFTDGKLLS